VKCTIAIKPGRRKDKSKYRTEAYREYMRNYQKSWHQKNKAQRLAHALERKKQMRVFYNQLKATLECAQCGENHPATLQFHHRDPQKKDLWVLSKYPDTSRCLSEAKRSAYQYFAHTADLSAFAGCSAIPLNLLNLINLSESIRQGYSAERIKREIAKCTVLCANCHAKLHYEWAGKNKKPFQEGLAGQYLEIEQALAVSQEEEFAHAAENQYIPDGVDINIYDDS
jgi:hypothetical protein